MEGALIGQEFYGVIKKSTLADIQTNSMLLYRSDEKDDPARGKWRLPGGIVCDEDVADAENECWVGNFLGKTIERQVQIPGHIIRQKIQPIAPVYSTYSKGAKVRRSCIIIGEIHRQPRKGEIRYATMEDILCLAQSGELYGGDTGYMYKLCLRAIVSRDWYEPLKIEAATILQGMHKK